MTSRTTIILSNLSETLGILLILGSIWALFEEILASSIVLLIIGTLLIYIGIRLDEEVRIRWEEEKRREDIEP